MKHALLLAGFLLIASISAIGQVDKEKAAPKPRMILVGDHRIAVYCDGEVGRTPTVILMPGGGRTAADWAKVQPAVASFTRVCSYDPVNLGASDKTTNHSPSADELVADLHAWLKASGEQEPFILVGHSISGIYARRYATKYQDEVAGFVFVDSSHEEQQLRLVELDPPGPDLDEATARRGWFVKPGQRLEWKTELPLIVLARGQPFPRRARDGSDSKTNRMTEAQFASWDRIWRGFQEDFANRSKRGELRVAEQSGHFIQLDQPEMVIQAIRDVSKTR